MCIEIFNFIEVKKAHQILACGIIVLIMSACHTRDCRVKELKLLTNYSGKIDDKKYSVEADLEDAVLNGIVIPTVRQTKEGNFQFSFKLENTSGDLTRFWYKLYYQNESYKLGDSLAGENFYGSWEDTGIEFKATPEFEDQITIKDSFRIVGNPRNERIYYGKDLNKCYVTKQGILEVVNYINTIPSWKASIEKNALMNKVPLEDQQFAMQFGQ